jgi:predicted ferric reductase
MRWSDRRAGARERAIELVETKAGRNNGDFTNRLREVVGPGMPARVSRPQGRFDREQGSERQIWIAGGIGITPFLAWLTEDA